MTDREVRIVKRYEQRVTAAEKRATNATTRSRQLENEIAALRGKLRNLEARHSALQVLWRGIPPELHEAVA
jgi:phage shock protein A